MKFLALTALLTFLPLTAHGECYLWGTDGDDTLVANNGCDYKIVGLGGSDILIGGDGNDVLWGDSCGADTTGGTCRNGADIMTGGAGYDAFGFNTAAESRNGHVDVITDFTPGQDIIAMAGVCYHANVTCTWIGTAQFDGTPGEVRYWTTYPPEGNPVVVVSADLDGDGVSDFQIDLLGAVTLSASDFLFDSYPPN